MGMISQQTSRLLRLVSATGLRLASPITATTSSNLGKIEPLCLAAWFSTRTEATSLFTSRPTSLRCQRPTQQAPDYVEKSVVLKSLLTLTGFYSKRSELLEGGDILYMAVTDVLNSPAAYEVFNLDRSTFMHNYMLLSLHVWLLVNRLKGEGPDAKVVTQHMYSTFMEDVESRIYKHGVQMHIKKWAQKLEGIFYGTSIAYDKALRGEGSTLPEALLKNVYNNDITQRQYADLLASYLLRELECLRLTDTSDVLRGQLRFSPHLLDPPAPAASPAHNSAGSPVGEAPAA